MFVMVTFIATLIHLFSIGYMADELQKTVEDHEVHSEHGHFHRRGRFGRFFLFLSLFCFSMLNLILADNLFQVFVSWELVGVCSYLLIGFYYERTSAGNAANKAFITNRVGDAGFIIGLVIIWTYVGTLNFQEVFQRLRCPGQLGKDNVVPLGWQVVGVDIWKRRRTTDQARRLQDQGQGRTSRVCSALPRHLEHSIGSASWSRGEGRADASSRCLPAARPTTAKKAQGSRARRRDFRSWQWLEKVTARRAIATWVLR